MKRKQISAVTTKHKQSKKKNMYRKRKKKIHVKRTKIRMISHATKIAHQKKNKTKKRSRWVTFMKT